MGVTNQYFIGDIQNNGGSLDNFCVDEAIVDNEIFMTFWCDVNGVDEMILKPATSM